MSVAIPFAVHAPVAHGMIAITHRQSNVPRAATWDDVDADLEMIQRDATFRALDGPLRVLERVRGNLAELRWRQGESEPRLQNADQSVTQNPVGDNPYFRKRPETGIQPDQISETPADLNTARSNGYVGEFCQDCGSPNMIRTGTCLTCTNCGGTSGCS